MSSNSDIDLKIGVTATADTSALDIAQAKIDKLKAPDTGTIPVPSMPGATPANSLSPSLPTGDQEKVWAKVAEERERINRNLKDGYDDLIRKIDEEADAIENTGKAGQRAGEDIAAGADKASQQTSLLKSAWGKMMGGISMAIAGWNMGRQIGDWVAKSLETAVDKAEQAARKKLSKLHADLRKSSEFTRMAVDAKNAEDVKNLYDDEQKAVTKINDLYKDRLALVDQMAANRAADLAAQQKILDAEKEFEASKVRQKVMAGTITESQGKKALLALEAKSAEDRRRLEAEADASGVDAARQKLALAEENEKLLKKQLASSAGSHLLYSGAEYLKYVNDAQPAIKGSPRWRENEGRWEQAQRNMDSGIPSLVKRGERDQDALWAEERAARKALDMMRQIEERASAKGIAPEAEEDREVYAEKLALRIDEARETNKALKDQLKQSGENSKQAAAALQDAVANQARGNMTRAAQEQADKTNNAEQNTVNRNEQNARLLQESNARLGQYLQNFLAQMTSLRNSGDLKTQSFLSGNMGGKLAGTAERLAQQGYAGDSEIAKLKKDLQELKDSNYPNDIKRQFISMIGGMLAELSQAQQRAARLQTPVAAQKAAEDKFRSGEINLRSSAAGKLSPSVERAIRETKAAIGDGNLSQNEYNKLNQSLRSLLLRSNDQATKDAVNMMSDFLEEYARGQMKKNKAGAGVTKGKVSQTVERTVINQIREALKDNKIDEKEEKPALQAALAQVKASGASSQTSQGIIRLLEQMISNSEMTISDATSMQSQLNALQKRVDTLSTQAKRPRNKGR